MSALFQAFAQAWRGLRRARGLTIAAVLTLAVGIAATTAMFALVEGVLLRPLPVRDQDSLIVAWKAVESPTPGHWPFSIDDLAAIRRESRLLEQVAGVSYTGALPVGVIENGAAGSIRTAAASGDLFAVLGVDPVLGRSLQNRDDVAGAEHVLVISHGLWQRRYGGSPGAVGRRMIIGERPFTVVGVMPPDVEFPRGVEAWMTVAAAHAVKTNEAFQVAVDLVARLRPDVTAAQAEGELKTLVARLDAGKGADAADLRLVMRSYEDVVVGDVRGAMLVLFAAVGLVLVIASANVANLLLMHGAARRPELAVRAALGASRGRLVRDVLTESLLLSLAAGGVGLAAAYWLLQVVPAIVPDGLPRVDGVRLDAGVVAFCMILACVTAALAGLWPALSSSRTDLVTMLRGGGRAAAGDGAPTGRRTLVVAQVALAMTVVAAAGLLVRSLLEMQAVGAELAVDKLVLARLALPQADAADRARHLRILTGVVEGLEASPGVGAATAINATPFAGTGWDALFTAEGQSADEAAGNPLLNLESILPGYFDTFEVALVRGRHFTGADNERAPEVAIVSEDVAARLWPGEDPIGRRLKIGGAASDQPWRTIVGVVRPTRYRELRDAWATLYLPAEQFLVSAQTIALRTELPPAAAAALVREQVRAADPDVQVMSVAPFAELLERPLARPRFYALLIGLFGTVSLLLSAIGLYAVMGASVRQRDREMGVRAALGATAGDLRRLVLGEGLRLAAVGAALGLIAAAAGTRLMRGLLFEVQPLDPLALGGAALLLAAAAVLATYLPARRAARVDPAAMLRAD
jgi:predicted permease